jgi:hypothetical protein
MDIEATLTTIRAALAPDATPEARAAGAIACRAMLAALEGSSASVPSTQPVPKLDPAAIASAISALRGVPPDQLLDLAIAKLRSALPAGTQAIPTSGFKLPIIAIPPQGGR